MRFGSWISFAFFVPLVVAACSGATDDIADALSDAGTDVLPEADAPADVLP